MLIKFSVKNFRGFPGRLEWDLSHPSNYSFNGFAVRDGVVRCGIVYGRNGSGKTNLGLALMDIVCHLTQKHRPRGYYDHFAYMGNAAAPVEFEYVFRLDGETMRYAYSKTRGGRLAQEELEVEGKMVFERRGRKFSIDGAAFPMGEAARKALVEGENRVSVVNFLLASYPLTPDNCLMRLRQFAEGMLWVGRSSAPDDFIGLDEYATLPEEYIVRKGLTEGLQQFLKAVGGEEFRFVAPRSGDGRLLCEVGKERAPFAATASAGMKALAQLYFWMQKMQRATLVFIDDFDASCHYATAFELSRRLFNLPPQVFTTAHTTFLMTNELLRPDCNFLLHDGSIHALCDLTRKELRAGHNIEKIYRGNGFGGGGQEPA